LCACALLSKSMAVSLPLVLLILDVYPLRRLGGSIGWWSAPARRVYVEKIPFVLLAGAAATIAFLALVQQANMASLARLSVLGRLAVSAYSLSFYLWKMVVPLHLSPLYELASFYPLGQLNPWAVPFIVSYGVVLAITALTLGLRRRWPGLPAVWLAYVVILLPVLGIFQNGPQIAADRYTYLAGLGWAVLGGAGLLAFRQPLAFLPLTLVVGVLVGLGVLTWNQVHVWHDSQTLWTHALAIDPRSPTAHQNVGTALAQQGKPAEAIEHYRHALKIRPEHADTHNNWGLALARQGKPAEAGEHFRQALRLRPDFADAHNNSGATLAEQGKLAEAIEHYQQALRFNPDHASAHYNWGMALAAQGKLAEAIEHYQQALRLKPDYADALNNWGAALARQGKPAEAIEHYQPALRLKPDHAAAHRNWGLALAEQGRLAEAIEHYQQALRLKPDFADALNDWGEALARQGQPAEAIEYYRRALRIDPALAEARSNLVNALLGLGRRNEAMEYSKDDGRPRPSP
jgi:protein O-mannosyl-transferase